MRYIIQIPKPCHESWDQMTQDANGRHCASCCKTVIDFTGWQQEDILHYLQQNSGRTCGRFRDDQLNVPVSTEQFITSVARSRLPYYRQVAAVLLFAFGMLQMSCDTHTAGTPAIIGDTVISQTLGKPAVSQGELSGSNDTTKSPVKKKVKKVKATTHPNEIMGDIELFPEPPAPTNDTAKIQTQVGGAIYIYIPDTAH